MQSTGHASTQAVSFTPMQGSAMMYAMSVFSLEDDLPALGPRDREEPLLRHGHAGLLLGAAHDHLLPPAAADGDPVQAAFPALLVLVRLDRPSGGHASSP